MTAKTILYTVFALSLLFIPLLHSESMLTITGNAASSVTNQQANYGTYASPADYQTEIHTDFSEYKDMRLKAVELVQDALDCETSKELKQCITDLNQNWQTSCGNEEEEIFFGFVDEFEKCALSEDDYCLCSLSLEPKPKYGQGAGLTIMNTSRGTVIKSDHHTHLVPVFSEADMNEDGSFKGDKSSFLLSLTYNTRGSAQLLSLTTIDYYDEILVYKRDSDMIFISEIDVLTKQRNEGHKVKNCTVQKKRKYRFCTSTGKRLIGQDVEYRFALDFRDDTAPVQPNVNIIGGDSHIVFSWNEIPDADHYNIYVSMTPFSDITDMEPSYTAYTGFADLQIYYKKGVRYAFVNGVVYHVAVVPVDKSGNYQKSGLVVVSAQPKSLNSTGAGLLI